METGLTDKWFDRNNRYPGKCKMFQNSHRNLNARGEKTNLFQLSISHLMGPFIILLVGYITALTMLGAEIIFHMLADLAFAIQQIARQSNALAYF